MKQTKLEERVAALEKKVADLEAERNGGQKKDWRSIGGAFTGDEVMRRIMENALEIREKDRQKARRKFAKRKTS